MLRDFREALRLLRANPGFAAVIVLTLALGIGVNSTIFSVLHGVLLRPLQYANPERARRPLGIEPAARPGTGRRLRRHVSRLARAVEDLREHRRVPLPRLHADGHGRRRSCAERIASVDVSPALFTVLGVPALQGPHVHGRRGTARPRAPRRHQPRRLAPAIRRRGRRDRADAAARRRAARDRRRHAAGLSVARGRSRRRGLVAAHARPDVARVAAAPHVQDDRPARAGRRRSIRRARRWTRIAGDIAREHPDSNAGWGVSLVPGARAGRRQHRPHALDAVRRRRARAAHRLREHREPAARAVGAWRRATSPCARRSAPAAGRSSGDRSSRAACSRWPAARAGLALAWVGIRALRPLDSADGAACRRHRSRWRRCSCSRSAMAIGAGILFGVVPAWRAMKPNLLATLQEGGRSTTISRRVALVVGRDGRVRGGDGADARDRRRSAAAKLRPADVGGSRLPHVARRRVPRRAAGCALPRRPAEAPVLRRPADADARAAGVQAGQRRVRAADESARRAVRSELHHRRTRGRVAIRAAARARTAA